MAEIYLVNATTKIATPVSASAPFPVYLAGASAGTSVVDTELPAAAAFPAANSQAISGLSVPDIRSFLAILDANGDINSSLLGGRQANSDAFTGAGVGRWLQTVAYEHRLSGANGGTAVERVRNNGAINIHASAARTATPTKADQTNYNWRGIHVVIDVTAIAATPSVVFTIQGKDDLSGKYYTILASAAITGTGTTVLKVFPGATAAANLAANDMIPRTFAIDAVHGDADSITYSVAVLGVT